MRTGNIERLLCRCGLTLSLTLLLIFLLGRFWGRPVFLEFAGRGIGIEADAIVIEWRASAHGISFGDGSHSPPPDGFIYWLPSFVYDTFLPIWLLSVAIAVPTVYLLWRLHRQGLVSSGKLWRSRAQTSCDPTVTTARARLVRRSRLRRTLRWSGVCVSAALLLLWLCSALVEIDWSPPGRRWEILISGGELRVLRWAPSLALRPGQIMPCVSYRLLSPFRVTSWWPRTGFLSDGVRTIGTSAVVPLWIPVIMMAIPTGLLFRRNRSRVDAGSCTHCGYDLRGNLSGVCPECGTPCLHTQKGGRKRGQKPFDG